jgi:hypothetical protein
MYKEKLTEQVMSMLFEYNISATDCSKLKRYVDSLNESEAKEFFNEFDPLTLTVIGIGLTADVIITYVILKSLDPCIRKAKGIKDPQKKKIAILRCRIQSVKILLSYANKALSTKCQSKQFKPISPEKCVKIWSKRKARFEIALKKYNEKLNFAKAGY